MSAVDRRSRQQSLDAFKDASRPSPADAAAMAMDALRRIVGSLRSADAASEALLGVSAAQLFVLRELAKTDSLTVGELAQRTATAQSSVSEVVARLATKELVVRERSASDRRRMDVSLSASGRTLMQRADETVQEKLLAGFSRLPDARQTATAAGLRSWVAAAGLADIEPTMFFEP